MSLRWIIILFVLNHVSSSNMDGKMSLKTHRITKRSKHSVILNLQKHNLPNRFRRDRKHKPYCASRLTRAIGHTTDCCLGRNDDCSIPYYDTMCYCDQFCHRTKSTDCCPDYYAVCFDEQGQFLTEQTIQPSTKNVITFNQLTTKTLPLLPLTTSSFETTSIAPFYDELKSKKTTSAAVSHSTTTKSDSAKFKGLCLYFSR